MTCISIPNGFLCVADTDFKCPYCKKKYNDNDDFYYDRMMKNKSGITKIKCSCGERFGLTCSYLGHVAFNLNP